MTLDTFLSKVKAAELPWALTNGMIRTKVSWAARPVCPLEAVTMVLGPFDSSRELQPEDFTVPEIVDAADLIERHYAIRGENRHDHAVLRERLLDACGLEGK